MKVIACLSWYDEQPGWLAATVASLAECADHVVAVDGAYALYPRAAGRSPSDQAEAVVRAAETAGLGLTLYQPREPFAGGEVEKRSLSLRLAETIATPYEDWYLVIDGDEVVLDVGPTFRCSLELTDRHVATFGLTEWLPDPYADGVRESYADLAYEPPAWAVQVRRLYRALPRLRYEHSHAVVTAELKGRQVYLFAPEFSHELEPAAELYHALRVEHRNRQRPSARAQTSLAYYHLRDRLGVETLEPPKVEVEA